MEVSPDYAPLYINYAILLSILGKDTEVINLLEKALKVPGIDMRNVQREFGFLYERQGKFAQAKEAYKKALQLSWTDEDVKYFKSNIDRCNTKEEILK